MKGKSYFLIPLIFIFFSCQKADPVPQNPGGGGGGTPSPTLTISPGVVINIPYNGVPTFTVTTNGLSITVDGAPLVGTTFTGSQLQANRSYLVNVYSGLMNTGTSKSVTVNVIVGQNPVITTICTGSYTRDSTFSHASGTWTLMYVDPCLRDDIYTFVANGDFWHDQGPCIYFPPPIGQILPKMSWSLVTDQQMLINLNPWTIISSDSVWLKLYAINQFGQELKVYYKKR